MQTVAVRTSQNVTINYKIASLGDRIVAYIIDILILFAYLFLAIMFLSSNKIENVYIWVLAALPYFFYHLLSEIFMEGQSVGKRQMNIKVIKMDGSRPSIGSYLIRWVVRPIDNNVFIYGSVAIILYLVRGKGQRLGDLLAGTTVIKLTRQQSFAAGPLGEHFEEEYEPVFTEVLKLTDKDMDIISRALKVYRDTANSEPVELLSTKVQEKMNVSTSMPPVKFLHTVKKDFNKLTSGQ